MVFLKPITIILALFLINSCTSEKNDWQSLSGEAQGTTFSILYKDSLERDLSHQIDSVLKNIDLQLSTYVDTSIVSAFNQEPKGLYVYGFGADETYFVEMCLLSEQIKQATSGYFNPQLGQLFNLWDKDYANVPDSNIIESTVNEISSSLIQSFNQEKKNQLSLNKKSALVSLNFNAIAQGYTCDILANYLNTLNIQDYMVEVGGELIVKGKNKEEKPWSIGIDNPEEKLENRSLSTILSLNDGAIATSGSYRKFYQKKGKKYPHILNPNTGYPVNHSTLSVTVFHPYSCAKADAYATAFMAMGKDSTLFYLRHHPELNLEVYLIFEQNDSLKTIASTHMPIKLDQ